MDFISFFRGVLSYSSLTGTTVHFAVLFGVPIVLYLVVFTFEAIGLYTIACKRNLKNKWQAFVPFANTYLLGKLTGDCPFCGKSIKRIKVWLLLFELLTFISAVLYYTCGLVVGTKYFDDFREIVTETQMGVEIPIYQYDVSRMEGWRLTVYKIYDLGYYVYSLLDLGYTIFFIIAIVNFFKAYFAKNYFMLTIGCLFFPITGICIFAVRNNVPVNYNEYIKKKQAEFYNRRYCNNPYNSCGGPYTNGGGYKYDPYTGRPLNNDQTPKYEDPFKDFNRNQSAEPKKENESEVKKEDPFEEFYKSNKEDNGDKNE